MGLYLCIFNNEEDEIDGLEIGRYEYFGLFRDSVTKHLENENWGSIYPILVTHSDCDGVWTPEECRDLLIELEEIKESFMKLPPDNDIINYKKEIFNLFGIKKENLYDCFVDTDGENIIDRLQVLCKKAIEHDLDIMFQ